MYTHVPVNADAYRWSGAVGLISPIWCWVPNSFSARGLTTKPSLQSTHLPFNYYLWSLVEATGVEATGVEQLIVIAIIKSGQFGLQRWRSLGSICLTGARP